MRILFFLATFFLLFSCKENSVKKDLQLKKENQITSKKVSEDFDSFFKKFAKDSIYQKERIVFPLKCKTPDENDLLGEKIQTKLIKSSNFEYMDFTVDSLAMKKETDKYTIEKREKNGYMIYSRLGYDNGIYELYKFRQVEGNWYLVEIEDLSS
ncbi:DUF4348 domain-containing protein [uncultured Flavobacterium sp.]|uniref:DUF4348 domain-containing protein n=1 Tax=uncultured Flavobacterium sp. TaxID=165435 RepID=UPI00292F4C90|nr:DUF4348 domain-containing protein [uncultured Flavobacterium sp.]